MTLNEWKEWSEIVKNGFSICGVVSGIFVLYKWISSRRDRATDILLDLDRQFSSAEMVAGRRLVEDDREWNEVRGILLREVSVRTTREGGERVDGIEGGCAGRVVVAIDRMLHFYVLLCGVREARQVPDSSLRKCFRYWLAHYYDPKRTEFRLYIDSYFPTLSDWLRSDRQWLRVRLGRTFFGPERFGWFPD